MKFISVAILFAAFFAPTLLAQGDSFGSKPSGTTAPTATPPAASPPAATPAEPNRVSKGDETAAPASKATPQSSAPTPSSIITPLIQPPDVLPTAKDIFAKSLTAIGGEAAIRKHTCIQTKGTLSISNAGMEGTLEIITLAPNKIVSTVDFQGVGKIKQGFDGTVGWSLNPMQGPSLIEGTLLEELKKSSDMYKDLDPSKIWNQAECKRAVNFGGVACYEIAVSGGPGEGALYYEIESGLTRGMVLTVETPMGKMPSTTIMSEYKEYDGVKIATRTDVEAMNMQQVLLVNSVSFAPMDAALFDLPPEIKALVSAAQNPAAAAPEKSAKNPNRIRVKPNAANSPPPGSPTPPPASAPTPPPASAPTPPPTGANP